MGAETLLLAEKHDYNCNNYIPEVLLIRLDLAIIWTSFLSQVMEWGHFHVPHVLVFKNSGALYLVAGQHL